MIAVIDYEMIQVIDCIVTATDSGTPSRSSTVPVPITKCSSCDKSQFSLQVVFILQIRINVIDINDNWPVFGDDLLLLLSKPFRIYENSIKTTPTGSSVLCDFDTGICLPGLHATDADSGVFNFTKNIYSF
jgi:hypothetical protein